VCDYKQTNKQPTKAPVHLKANVHGFDADPNPTFRFDVDSDPDHAPGLKHFGKSEKIS
jgi:hypothetical protein